MGALSVVICAILSSIFLKEKLTLFGWLGCSLCIVSILVCGVGSCAYLSVIDRRRHGLRMLSCFQAQSFSQAE